MAKIKSVHIKCGCCGTSFPSAISFGDTEAFQSATLMGYRQQCPGCSEMVPWNAESMTYEVAGREGGFTVHYGFPPYDEDER